jgi:hypothetical protein
VTCFEIVSLDLLGGTEETHRRAESRKAVRIESREFGVFTCSCMPPWLGLRCRQMNPSTLVPVDAYVCLFRNYIE